MIIESWISPKAQKGLPSKIAGKGLFAKAFISRNEVIVAKAGHFIDAETLRKKTDIIKGSEVQIADKLFVAPLTEEELEASMAYCNHSCDPNAGFGGNILVVAMRDIEVGEEITLDYAMDWTDIGEKLICNCLSEHCRKVITGHDWQDLKLQKKYAGYFSWYIEQKIKDLNSQFAVQ